VSIFMSEKKPGEDDLSLLSPGTTMQGKIVSEGSIRIDGKLVGDIFAKANAAVGATGVVEGNIEAKHVSVAGRVTGNIVASAKLVLEEKSVTRGDIRAAILVVDEGAVLDGHCVMSKEGAASKAGSPTPH
jgi:cytoskeletal protein CcmA (bactofilin family)